MYSKSDWRAIIRRIRDKKFMPIISDRITFPDQERFISSWAERIDYPFALDKNINLAQVAQFLSATTRDELTAKEEYIDFSKAQLLEEVRRTAAADQEAFLETLEDELFNLSFSEVAARLNYPHYEDEFENPLRLLAELPLPIYITTSQHDFIETALRRAGKEPQTEICYWADGLDDIPSAFKEDPPYEPSVEKPLVYHLHGLDSYPSSLVLTEDDYLDFLVRVSEDLDAVPLRIRQALVDSSLVLLGYRLTDWDFKVIFRGLIKTKRDSRRHFSVSIQYDPEKREDAEANAREVQEYLERYFDKARFDIYWGEPLQFSQELWQQWEAI